MLILESYNIIYIYISCKSPSTSIWAHIWDSDPIFTVERSLLMKKYPISDEKRGAAANVSYLKLSFDGKIAGKCSF